MGGPSCAAAGETKSNSSAALAASSMWETRIRDDLFHPSRRARKRPQHQKGAAANDDHDSKRDDDQNKSSHMKFRESCARGAD